MATKNEVAVKSENAMVLAGDFEADASGGFESMQQDDFALPFLRSSLEGMDVLRHRVVVGYEAEAEGVTVQDRLDAIAARYGRHVIAERSVRLDPAVGQAAVLRMREQPPAEVGGRTVRSVSRPCVERPA